MNLDRFVQQRQPSWRRLEELGHRARKEIRRLGARELDELGRLYRGATADLALAQRDFPDQPVTRYLNQLVGQTHAVIYRGGPLRWQQVQEFYRRTFPTLYRSLAPYLTASFVLFFLPALIAFGSSTLDGVLVIVFVIVYQQVENYFFSPRISNRTMNIHPAVAFGAVIVGAALGGAMGALIAIPIVASIQAIVETYGRRYEIIPEMAHHEAELPPADADPAQSEPATATGT